MKAAEIAREAEEAKLMAIEMEIQEKKDKAL